jgi:hypothetical protein
MGAPSPAGDPLLGALPSDGKGHRLLGGIPLERRLGVGGMGVVYYAKHPRLGLEVAVKVLPPHMVAQDPTLIARFTSEAKLAAALNSDHVVRVIDINEDRGLHYLVMEYVDGESAGVLLRRPGGACGLCRGAGGGPGRGGGGVRGAAQGLVTAAEGRRDGEREGRPAGDS